MRRGNVLSKSGVITMIQFIEKGGIVGLCCTGVGLKSKLAC
ncbi:MAG: hypothetical protein Q4D14_06700 [Bacteroidales bacterium]|nr:hypothetical protein [Bacteroidales bacterium]